MANDLLFQSRDHTLLFVNGKLSGSLHLLHFIHKLRNVSFPRFLFRCFFLQDVDVDEKKFKVMADQVAYGVSLTFSALAVQSAIVLSVCS